MTARVLALPRCSPGSTSTGDHACPFLAEQFLTQHRRSPATPPHRLHLGKPHETHSTSRGTEPSKPGWTLPPRQVEGKHTHAHAHLHASADGKGAPRRRVDLSMLSKAEVAQLQAITAKLLPVGVKTGAIEIGSPTDEE